MIVKYDINTRVFSAHEDEFDKFFSESKDKSKNWTRTTLINKVKDISSKIKKARNEREFKKLRERGLKWVRLALPIMGAAILGYVAHEIWEGTNIADDVNRYYKNHKGTHFNVNEEKSIANDMLGDSNDRYQNKGLRNLGVDLYRRKESIATDSDPLKGKESEVGKFIGYNDDRNDRLKNYIEVLKNLKDKGVKYIPNKYAQSFINEPSVQPQSYPNAPYDQYMKEI